MQEFRPSTALLVKNTIFGLVGGFAAGFAIHFLFANMAAGIVVGAALGLLVLYFTLVQDNIVLRVDADTLAVTRVVGGQTTEYSRAECRIEANVGITRGLGLGDTPCFLFVQCPDEKPRRVDCTMLGKTRFLALLEALGLSGNGRDAGMRGGGSGAQPPKWG